jgi:hypothetical protein
MVDLNSWATCTQQALHQLNKTRFSGVHVHHLQQPMHAKQVQLAGLLACKMPQGHPTTRQAAQHLAAAPQ